jgi:hypothetical protein
MDTDKNKDDLADALARLASGGAPSPSDGVPSDQVPLTPDQTKQRRPSAPAPASSTSQSKSLPASSARPNAPGVRPPSSKPASAARAPNSPSRPKPPKPVRPDAPTLSQRPGESAPSPPVEGGDLGSSLANVIDDDDAVIVPAPGPAVFAHRPAPPALTKRVPLHARLGFRRTMIPILLTLGLALPVTAIWWMIQEDDSPIRELGWQFPVTLTVIGIVMLGLGILNMVQVKRQMDEQPR